MNNIHRIAIILVFSAVSTLTGCAKFPSSPISTGQQLVITLKVKGSISPLDPLDPSIHRYYFIAIDNDGDPNTGPWAVAYPPYGGNGWVTSRNPQNSVGVTSYLEFDASNPGGNVYNILPGSFFLNTTAPQPPINYQLVDASTIRFVIDFSQIATAAIPASSIKQLDINFITTNQLAVDPNQMYPAGCGMAWARAARTMSPSIPQRTGFTRTPTPMGRAWATRTSI